MTENQSQETSFENRLKSRAYLIFGFRNLFQTVLYRWGDRKTGVMKTSEGRSTGQQNDKEFVPSVRRCAPET